ncbi:MAG: SH3 domain-containing protein [Sedimentisphaerales bacterium]
MQSYTKFINLFILICLISMASIGFAQEANSPQESGSVTEAEGNELSFPYVAEITEDNVNVRSGPGTNYYHCIKLSAGDKVKVIASKYSWSHIVPPAGSFSWISKQYVSIEPNNHGIGVITGDAVRVYAGSDFLKPMHSTTVQLELGRGDKVELMGEEMDDYYKITPPSGAYLWVLTQYTKPVGAVGEVAVTVEPKAEAGPKAEPEANNPAVVPAPAITSIESEKLKEYYALADEIKAEQAKPIDQQNYAEIKKGLAELAGNKDAGKAARYSEFAIKQIERCELVLAVSKEVQLQDSQLQNIREQIESARVAKLAQIPELGKFVAIGQFQTSKIYGQEEKMKHYRILDESGQTVCYALPEGPISQDDLSKFVGRKVGLVGTIEPHPQTKGALVRFTEITELK